MSRLWGSLPLILLVATPFFGYAEGLAQTAQCSGTDCQICHVVYLINGVIAWLVMILGTVAAIIIVYAGFKLVTSGGNRHAKEDAKELINNMLIGYVIVLAGWLLIDTGMKMLLVDGETKLGMWNELSCVDQPDLVSQTYEPDEFEPYVRPTASGLNLTPMSGGDVTLNVAAIRAAGDTVSMVEAAARAAGITDQRTVKTFVALVMQESSLCRNKVGPSTKNGTAYGCGQMLLSTAKGLDPNATVTRLRDDNAYNLGLSARYFAQQLRRYNGNIRLTLASYNGGDKANEQSQRCPGQLSWECELNDGYAQTRNYVSNIMRVAAGL